MEYLAFVFIVSIAFILQYKKYSLDHDLLKKQNNEVSNGSSTDVSDVQSCSSKHQGSCCG